MCNCPLKSRLQDRPVGGWEVGTGVCQDSFLRKGNSSADLKFEKRLFRLRERSGGRVRTF